MERLMLPSIREHVSTQCDLVRVPRYTDLEMKFSRRDDSWIYVGSSSGGTR